MNDKIIKGDPSKSFFINMLTRDISLTDCILDLIDNSIDSVLQNQDLDIFDLLDSGSFDESTTIFSNRNIWLTLNDQSFVIKDDCFGISIDIAKNHAFRFGSLDDRLKSKSGLSVYGIGMKRSFFKIGKQISVDSKTKNSFFSMNIDVDKWESDEKWDFYFDDLNIEAQSETGTTIKITELNKNLKKRLANSIYINEIKNKISNIYSLFIDAGLKIHVNSKLLESNLPHFINTDDISTVRQKLDYKSDNGNLIKILVIAGLSRSKDKSLDGGWYVFCNGRLILEKNRDKRTGWGVDFPSFHNKFNSFTGFMLFNSTDVEQLPWTTTKEDIEIDSPVYQFALNHAKIFAKPVTTFLSNMYPSNNEVEDIIPDNRERELLKTAKTIEYKEIAKTEQSFKYTPRKPSETNYTTISYKKTKDEVNKIKSILGKKRISNKEIGELTFDYYINMESE